MLHRTIPALPLHIVLVLVALFNALAGAPLHEARHMQELVGNYGATTVAAGDRASAAIDTQSPTPTTDDHGEEAHTTCAWCLTHALDGGVAPAPGRQLALSMDPGAISPRGTGAHAAQQMRWPFAARGPPQALLA